VDTAFKLFYASVLTAIVSATMALLDPNTGMSALLYERLFQLSPALAKIPNLEAYIHRGGMALLWAVFYYSRTIATGILAALPPLRRLLAWNRFIEGDWPLVVVDRRNGTLIYYGFMRIGFAGGYLQVKGDDWTPEGRYALPFSSVQTCTLPEMPDTLHYWYKQGEGDRQRGYTFIEFFRRGEVATHMTGEFHDRDHPDVRFYGRKLKYGWFRRRAKTLEQKRLAAKAFADDIMPCIPEIVKNPVNYEWETRL